MAIADEGFANGCRGHAFGMPQENRATDRTFNVCKHAGCSGLRKGQLLGRQTKLAGFVDRLDQAKVLELQTACCQSHFLLINFGMHIVNQFI